MCDKGVSGVNVNWPLKSSIVYKSEAQLFKR